MIEHRPGLRTVAAEATRPSGQRGRGDHRQVGDVARYAVAPEQRHLDAEADVLDAAPSRCATARHRRVGERLDAQLEGVTQSADWGFDDPEDYSAPV